MSRPTVPRVPFDLLPNVNSKSRINSLKITKKQNQKQKIKKKIRERKKKRPQKGTSRDGQKNVFRGNVTRNRAEIEATQNQILSTGVKKKKKKKTKPRTLEVALRPSGASLVKLTNVEKTVLPIRQSLPASDASLSRLEGRPLSCPPSVRPLDAQVTGLAYYGSCRSSHLSPCLNVKCLLPPSLQLLFSIFPSTHLPPKQAR